MMEIDKDLKLRLSQLLDGELSARDNPRLVERVASDRELKAAWARYSLIGQIMRAPGESIVDAGFAERVSAAITDEPTVLAPRPAAGRSLRGKAASFALAASLLGVAVLLGKSLTDNASGLFEAADLEASRVTAPDAVESMADAQFNDYLLMHNETATMAGSGGLLPNLRLVSSR